MKVLRNKELADPRPLNASSCQRAFEKMVWWSFVRRLIGRAHRCLLHSEATLLQSARCVSVTVLTACL
jgi:hypothetical protein